MPEYYTDSCVSSKHQDINVCRLATDKIEILELDNVRSQLGIGFCDKDLDYKLENVTIPAAIQFAENYTGITIYPSKWELRVTGCIESCKPIRLRRPPNTCILSFQYRNSCCGNWLQLGEDQYCIDHDCCGWLVRLNRSNTCVCNTCNCQCRPDDSTGYKIEYKSGYTCAEDVPEELRTSLLVLVEYFYDRGDESLLMFAKNLLDHYRLPSSPF